MNQQIKITPVFQAALAALKSPWVIICEDYAVGAYEGRAKARTAKADGKLVGKIVPASEVTFEVVDLRGNMDPDMAAGGSFPIEPEAPAEAPVNQPVHSAILDFLREPISAPIAPAMAPVVAAAEAAAAPVKTPKIPLVRESTTERPCKRVWHIADEMATAAGGHKNIRRKDVLARCVAEGVAFYTARTQYQLWLTIQNGGSI